MRAAVPHPVVSAVLLAMWLLLTRFSPGQFLIGGAVALLAGRAYALLTPEAVRLRRPDLMLRLFLTVGADIIASNIAVAWLILSGGRGGARRSGFVRIPLELRQRAGLAVLAMIVTATPGTVWVDYDPATGALLIHVLDLTDEAAWRNKIKGSYEAPLLEIFG